MKVGLVIDDRISRPGGIQEYVFGLYDYLVNHGHQAVIFTSGHFSSEIRGKRKIIGIGKPLEILGTDAQKAFPLLIGQLPKIKRNLAKENLDILHIQGFPGPLSYEFLRHSKAINVMTYHVTNEPLIADFFGKALSPVWKKFNEKIQGRIAISPIARLDARKFFPGRCTIIPIGIDTQRFSPEIKTIPKFQDGKINILFVGRLDRKKGIKYLLKAFQRVSNLVPGYRLLLVGDGPQKKKAVNFVRQNELRDVAFIGKVSRSDLPAYYATGDIFCSPATHGESFGVVLLEAMAAGLPVVAFDNPGYHDLLPEYGRGFLVFNRSVSALAQALLILGSDKKLRQKLARKNRQFAESFSWEKIGKKIVAFYQQFCV